MLLVQMSVDLSFDIPHIDLLSSISSISTFLVLPRFIAWLVTRYDRPWGTTTFTSVASNLSELYTREELERETHLTMQSRRWEVE